MVTVSAYSNRQALPDVHRSRSGSERRAHREFLLPLKRYSRYDQHTQSVTVGRNRHSATFCPLGLSPRHFQDFLAPGTLQPFVVNAPASCSQHRSDPPMVVTPIMTRQRDGSLREELFVAPLGLGSLGGARLCQCQAGGSFRYRQARLTRSTACLRPAGLVGFPAPPHAGWRCPATDLPPASSAGCSISPASSAGRPDRSAAYRTPSASDSRSAR